MPVSVIFQRWVWLALLCLSASCASTPDLHYGLGGRGFFSFTADLKTRSEPLAPDETRPFSGAGFQRRALAVDATVGVGVVDAVVGWEWTHLEGEDFQTRLLGLRVRFAEPEAAPGSYVELLGRSLQDPPSGHQSFEGFELGVGALAPIPGGLVVDIGAHWVYVKRDAIRPGSDEISQLWIGLGLRLEF